MRICLHSSERHGRVGSLNSLPSFFFWLLQDSIHHCGIPESFTSQDSSTRPESFTRLSPVLSHSWVTPRSPAESSLTRSRVLSHSRVCRLEPPSRPALAVTSPAVSPGMARPPLSADVWIDGAGGGRLYEAPRRGAANVSCIAEQGRHRRGDTANCSARNRAGRRMRP